MLHQGKILSEGSYHELQVSDLDFAKLLGSTIETTKNQSNTSTVHFKSNMILTRQMSTQSATSSVEETKFNEFEEELVELAETRTSGSVSSNVYFNYLSAGGSCFKISFFFFVCIFTQILASGADLWVTYWYILE